MKNVYRKVKEVKLDYRRDMRNSYAVSGEFYE